MLPLQIGSLDEDNIKKGFALIISAIMLINLAVFVSAAGERAVADNIGLTLSYFSNATDQNGQPLIITATPYGFSPSKITWYQNGTMVGTGNTFTLVPEKVGKYNITAIASTATGGSFLATGFFTVNPPLSIASLNVPASTNDGKVTAVVSVFGGTPPFTYQWQLNGVTQLGCQHSTSCLLNLTKQGLNNITVMVFDSANAQTQSQVARVLYQQASASSSSPMLMYAGVGAGAAFAVVIIFVMMMKRKEKVGERTTAVSEESMIRRPLTYQQYKAYDKPVQIKEAPKTVYRADESQSTKPGGSYVANPSARAEVNRDTFSYRDTQPNYAWQPKQVSQPIIKQEKVEVKSIEQKPQQVMPPKPASSAVNEPVDWIIQCVKGEGFWPKQMGPLPKSELEKEFKKRFPNITIANFNSMLYELIYKDMISSEIVNGQVVLKPGKAII